MEFLIALDCLHCHHFYSDWLYVLALDFKDIMDFCEPGLRDQYEL